MDFNKKEMPIQGFAGFGGGATSAAFRSSGISSKYIDDVFKINCWIGTGAEKEIDNGVNMSSEGGLVWVKNRSANDNNWIFQNVIGVGWGQPTNSNAQRFGGGPTYLTSFDNDGFTVGSNGSVNDDGDDIVAWTFRNSKAFQSLTYAGNGSNRTISHDLGSIPGLIFIKAYDSTENWRVYHTSLGPEKHLILNLSNASADSATQFNDTAPTSSVFSVGTDDAVNEDGKNFTAMIFAGGKSTAATAKSVAFDKSGDYLSTTSSSSDFTMGTGDFTVECWVYIDDVSTINGFWQISDSSGGLSQDYGETLAVAWDHQAGQGWQIYGAGTYDKSGLGVMTPGDKQWYHTAYVRSSGTSTLYINGIAVISKSDTHNYDGTYIAIGGYYTTSYLMGGKISNLRVVKGTAVYTSEFKPPTEPLTNITNTKLLCCNNSSTTGSTVTPATINSNGDPTASTDSPFDDPAGFAFGEDEDEPIMKCGSYVGNGSATGPEIYLGWEPQYIMIKRYDNTENWYVYDSMRGISTGHTDKELRPDSSTLEYTYSRVDVTSTGFMPMTDQASTNTDGADYVYFCVRRPDGIVGKPAEAGTDVFNIVDGDTDGEDPFFKNIGFPVDLGLFKKKTDASHNWGTSPRLTQGYYLSANQTRTENQNTHQMFDYDGAWNSGTDTGGGYFSYAWKRHAGFDVVTYEGNTTAGHKIRHNLNQVPEMMWVKNRDSARNWRVYHKGLNGGTNPQNYYMALNSSAAEDTDTTQWNDTAPTSTTFTVGTSDDVNNNSMIAFLFASVDGISKVGSFSGSDSDQAITLGFQPRFVVVKARSAAHSWLALDTLRGWATSSGNTSNYLFLDLADAQASIDIGYITSTGFVAIGNNGNINDNGVSYVYYAHA